MPWIDQVETWPSASTSHAISTAIRALGGSQTPVGPPKYCEAPGVASPVAGKALRNTEGEKISFWKKQEIARARAPLNVSEKEFPAKVEK